MTIALLKGVILVSMSFQNNSVFFLIVGILFLILGFNGESIASFISKPQYETSWFISGNLINTLTYVPMIIGGFFLIIALSRALFKTSK